MTEIKQATAEGLLPLVMATVVIVLVVTAIFEHVFGFATEESSSQCADNTVTSFVTEDATTESTGSSAHEATLAFLRMVRVGRITIVAIGVGRIARGGRTLTPWPALRVVLLCALLVTILLVAV